MVIRPTDVDIRRCSESKLHARGVCAKTHVGRRELDRSGYSDK